MTVTVSDSGILFADGSLQPTALTTGTQTIAGAKTFSTPIGIASGGTGASTAAAAVTALLGAQSTAASGYVWIGGVLVQWGNGTATAGGGTVTFPIAFPTGCRQVIACVDNAGSVAHNMTVNALTTTQCVAYAASTYTIRYIAIGY